MRLKIIDINEVSERESDFDTAVDLSHYAMQARAILFETPGGVRFSVISRAEQITHSYLEPDFDRIEETGEVVHQTHRDNTKGSNSSSLAFSGLYVAQHAKHVLASEFQDVFRTGALDPWDVRYDETRPTDVNIRVSAYLAEGDGRPHAAEQHFCQYDDNLIPPNIIAAAVANVELEMLANVHLEAGQVWEAPISQDFEEVILYAEQVHAKISGDNATIRNDNNACAAKARLNLAIDGAAAAAKSEIHQSFSRPRP